MQKVGNSIILKTSNDGLRGYMTLIAEDEDLQLKVNDYVEEINKYFKYGLNENLVKRVLTSGLIDEEICIAEGTPPIHGKDGNIKYNFTIEKPLLPKLNADGTVNYKELDSINNVKVGDILATIIPPSEGKDGINVKGDLIPHIKGKTPKFKYGKNVSLSTDKLSLVSDLNGLVELKNGRIQVLDLLILENLDNSVGNINFDGNVIINNDILNGYTLKAKGAVEVKGAIEGGYLECNDDVLVRRGIQGFNRLVINTKGNLSTKFIENSIVNVSKNITAEAIMHSQVTSKSNVLVLGKKGLIVGGLVRARYEIRARTIGSSMATNTVLEVGIDPDIKQRNNELESKFKTNKENLVKIDQSLNVLEVMKRSSKLDIKKLKLYNELVKAQLALSVENKKIKKELENIKFQMQDLSKGRVRVADVIYPGVKIIIGKAYLHIRDEMRRCSFYEENGEIRVGPY